MYFRVPGKSCSVSQIRFEKGCDSESVVLGILQDVKVLKG